MVRQYKDWGCDKDLNELSKGSFTGGGPSKGFIFFGQVEQWASNIQKALNKVTIKVAKTKESLDMFVMTLEFISFLFFYLTSCITTAVT